MAALDTREPARDGRVRFLFQARLGCKDEQRDSAAAYTQALAWSSRATPATPQRIRIMNAWATTLTGGHTKHNGPIRPRGRRGMARAAEIIRYTTDLWPPEEVARLPPMLKTQYVPSLAWFR